MAKSLSFTRSMTDKFSVKGLLSEDGKEITYANEDKEDVTIPIDRCFKNFCGENIEVTVATKMTQDLGDGSEEE